MYKFMPRSKWTDAPFGFSRLLVPSEVYFQAIHYPADKGLKPPHDGRALTEAQVAQRLRGYRRYHMAPEPIGRDWPDIGYPYAVDQAGRIWECAGKRVAAHSASESFPTANFKGVAILCVLGNDEEPTNEMINSINEFTGDLKDGSFRNLSVLYPHRGVPGASTSCPGDRLTRYIKTGAINLSGHRSQTYSIDRIKEIQSMLNALTNANLLVDGVLGPVTVEAVKRFQAANGLIVDGDPGPVTYAELKKHMEDEVSDIRFIKFGTKVYITDGVSMSHVNGPSALTELQAIYNTRTITPVSESVINSIPLVSNLSLADVSKAVKDGVTSLPGGVDAGQVADQVVAKLLAKITA